MMTSTKNPVLVTVPFSFNNYTVRTVIKDDDAWFVASDVCAVLGLGNITMSLKHLDDDESALSIIEVRSENGVIQKREVNIISESGLYALILRSRKAEAKKFRKWVTSEVLPSIRKTGSYTRTISIEQKGELSSLVAERFPDGKSRPYAWSRFNNHFRLASYKDLPAAKFAEAVEYIKQIPIKEETKLASGQRFILTVQTDGNMQCTPIAQNFVWELANAIKSPDNNSLSDQNLTTLAHACIEAIEYRAGLRREKLERLAG